MSPEKPRATKVAPSCKAMPIMSIAESELMAPYLLFDPLSDVAENWPFVRPYTPLFSTM